MTDSFDPTAYIPAGRLLTRETYDELMSEYESLGRPLTHAEIEAIVGEPIDIDTIRLPYKEWSHIRGA